MRLGATKASATSSYNGLGNQLYDLGGARPSLDLDFATNKTLQDNISTKTDIVTFTRASSGTYVGSDGLIKTAVTNLLLRSEEFDDAAWTKSEASITANSVASPDGAQTADTLVENTTNNEHRVSVTFSATNATAYTASIYVKAAGRTLVRFGFTAVGFSAGSRSCFDLSNGTITASAGGSPSITPLRNGWYRLSVTNTTTSATTITAIVQPVTDSINFSYTGDGTSGIYLWGAQLEQSSTVGEYIPTTTAINSAPRFDHNPTTGESLGLLVEEQRTNSWLQSENFGTSWLVARSSVSTNAIAAPDGNSTADKLVEDTTANNSHYIYQSVSVTSGTTYTASAFVKAGERTSVLLQFFPTNSAFASSKATFNLSTGAITDSSTVNAATITPYPNGWYRITATETATATATGNVGFILVSGTITESYTGDGTSGIYLWGAQLEAGAFPTSYIPTTTATVTRSADVASITGTNFSSWYRQDEGTVFVDGASQKVDGAAGGFLTINDLSGVNRLDIRQYRQQPILNGQGSAGVTWSGGLPSVSANVNYKQALGYSATADNHGNAFVGTLETSSSALGLIEATRVGFFMRDGQTSPSGNSGGTIKRLTFWPTRLPNETLQTITQ